VGNPSGNLKLWEGRPLAFVEVSFLFWVDSSPLAKGEELTLLFLKFYTEIISGLKNPDSKGVGN